jgi:glycosyltransferase involved in cell wall biosynthesis
VLVRDPDNAATELIEDGVNGFVADSASPEELGAAIVRVHEAAAGLRASTADWYGRHASELSLDASLDAVAESYSASVRA